MQSTEGFFNLKKKGLSQHTVDNEVSSHHSSFKCSSLNVLKDFDLNVFAGEHAPEPP